MSENDRYERETARRVTAGELQESETEVKLSNGEYEPSYLVLPSGGLASRVVFSGTLTELENVGSADQENWKARITDGSGSDFLVYAGQYQPAAASTLRRLHQDDEVPAFVTVVGKPSVFTPEEEPDERIVTIRPESVTVVSRETRNQFIAQAAERTLERLEVENDNFVAETSELFQDDEAEEQFQEALLADNDLRERVLETTTVTLENLQEAIE